MEDKKLLQKAKNIFTSLKTDPNCVLFSEEKIDSRLLKKLNKSKYTTDSLLLKLFCLDDNKLHDEEKLPTRVDHVEKREIDRSTLYSFGGTFRLIHACVRNLEFLGKNVAIPRYFLLAVDLHSSKVYVYPMCSRKQILQKINDEIKNKRKNKSMRLQVDNEFQQVKIKDLNDKYNIEMFRTSVRGGKAFLQNKNLENLKQEYQN